MNQKSQKTKTKSPPTPTQVVQTNTPSASTPPNNTSSSLSNNNNHAPVSMNTKSPFKPILAAFVIVLAGTVTGFGLSRAYSSPTSKSSSKNDQSGSTSSDQLQVGDVIGSQDEDTFRDPAEGVLVKGGIDGEGSHHLLREGGPARNVYLTSSVVDLDRAAGHRIKVWGETFAAQKAGWLMDVGRVEILELDATPPFEENTSNSTE